MVLPISKVSGAVKRGKCDRRARAAERCHVLSLSALLLHLSDYVDNNGHDANVGVNPVLGTKEKRG